MTRRLKLMVVVGLAVVGVVLAGRALRETMALSRANEVCGVVPTDADRARELAQALSPGSEPHRIASECLCLADFVAVSPERCLERLLPYMDDLDHGWHPDADVAVEVSEVLLQQERWPLAARMLDVVIEDHPTAVTVNELWLDAHGHDSPEDELMARVAERLRRAERVSDQLAMTAMLASRWHARGDNKRCVEVIGDVSRFAQLDAEEELLTAKSECLAVDNRRDDVIADWAAWVRRGGDPLKADALRCLMLLAGHAATVEDLERLLDIDRHGETLPLELRRLVARRLISDLLSTRPTDAAEVLARAKRDLGMAADSLADFERAVAPHTEGQAMVPVDFVLPSSTNAKLLVSTEGAAADTVFEEHDFVDGRVRLMRAGGRLPLRWVVRDGEGAPRASGSTWVKPGGSQVQVSLLPPPTAKPIAFRPPSLRPADGRRRVYVLIPDSWDWRLVNQLRARGELPVVDNLVRTGTSGVLWSDPPMTAAAMNALVYPEIAAPFGVLQLVHEMGEELGGLASIGSNPLDFVSPWLPQRVSLFETIGAGDRVVANLLFSHADIDAGRNAERTGPTGRHRRIAITRARRPLSAAELAVVGDVSDGLTTQHLDTIAAQLDLFADLIDAREDDLVLLRAEAVDLLTHRLFSETTTGRQDDARSVLFGAYRLIDRHLAEIAGRLDADDVLVIMSDHGAATSLQHDYPAVFIAWGVPVRAGHLDGAPALRGVPRYLADLLGVTTSFPETGLAAALPTSTTTSTP